MVAYSYERHLAVAEKVTKDVTVSDAATLLVVSLLTIVLLLLPLLFSTFGFCLTGWFFRKSLHVKSKSRESPV